MKFCLISTSIHIFLYLEYTCEINASIDTNGYMDISLINTSTTDQLNRILIHTYELLYIESFRRKETKKKNWNWIFKKFIQNSNCLCIEIKVYSNTLIF